MTKQISDLAQNQQAAKEAEAKAKRMAHEEWRKKAIPFGALVVANIVFLSLDVRGFDVVLWLTSNFLLAFLTVIVSGILALLWWDFALPHARRHRNGTQEKLSYIGTGLGIVLSMVLAFLDYIVRAQTIEEGFLWAGVVIVTVAQGVLAGWFWKVDLSVESDAKRQESVANRLDTADAISDFEAEIDDMAKVADKLALIEKKFPGKGQAEKAARAMGYPVLAEMLKDDDGDSIPNYRDKDYKPAVRPQEAPRATFPQKPMRVMAKDAEQAKLAESEENPTEGQS